MIGIGRAGQIGRTPSGRIGRDGEPVNMNPCSRHLAVTLVMYFMVYATLKVNTAAGGSVLLGDPRPDLVGNCIKEYQHLRILLFAGAAYTFGRIGLGYLAVLNPEGGCVTVILQSVEVLLAGVLGVLTFTGTYLTMFRQNAHDIQQCPDLHICARNLFVASFLLIIMYSVILEIYDGCSFPGLANAMLRAREHNAVAGDACSPYAELPDEETRPGQSPYLLA